MPPVKQLWFSALNKPHIRDKYVQRVREIDKKIGSFLSFKLEEHDWTALGRKPLGGVPVAVKDNIAVRGRKLTCGSRILENFVAPYTATAIRRLENAGALVVGKTNMDEFGMGSSNEHSALGRTSNPWDLQRVPGGSSGGSAAAVAAGLVPLAVGSDTGGSVRQPANFCGIYGFKPTYGSISRYGLTAYASSLEVIGLFAVDIRLLETAFETMHAEDEFDQSSFSTNISGSVVKKIAMLDIDPGMLETPVAEAYTQAAQTLRERGYVVEKVNLVTLKFVIPSYYTIANAEASANLARFDGIRYGSGSGYSQNPINLIKEARSRGFGDEVKLRILLGTYVLRSGFKDQYYIKAQRVRTLIRKELGVLLRNYPLLLMPVFPTQAFLRADSEMDNYKQRLSDIFTCLANLAGLPALSVPIGINRGLPTGVQFVAPAFGEKSLFDIARGFSEVFPVQFPPGALEIERMR